MDQVWTRVELKGVAEYTLFEIIIFMSKLTPFQILKVSKWIDTISIYHVIKRLVQIQSTHHFLKDKNYVCW